MNSTQHQSVVLITGATGMIGTLLVDALQARGATFTAMVRSSEKSSAIAKKTGVTLVEGDFDDPESLAHALTGVERAFLLTNSSEKTETQQKLFVEAASKANVKHIVKLSQLAANDGSPVRFLRYHAAVERAIRDSGMSWTFLRPNLILQAYLAFAGQVAGGKLQAPIGDARVSMVDARDIAAVAVEALLSDGHADKTYTLTGPQAVTHEEVATAFGRAIGRTVRFENMPADAFGAALKKMRMAPWQADGLVEDYAHYSRGEAAFVTDDVKQVTGHAATDIDAFARDYAAKLGDAEANT